MSERSFWVTGVPQTKGSWRVNAGGKGLRPDNKREKVWAATVGWAARAWRGAQSPKAKLIRGPLALVLMFRLPAPARSKYSYPSVGDIDKLARSVLDALSGILYVDDRQVVELIARKVFTANEPGVSISITEED